MAIGNYGTKRLANVNVNDIEIIYTYSPSRDELPTSGPTEIEAGAVLTRVEDPITDGLLNGWYNLRLPAASFSQIGFYNIIIRPREIITNITDCGTLAAFPDKKGIILDVNQLEVVDVNRLVGNRIEYFDSSNNRSTEFRIVTSANRVEPVNQNQPNTSQKSVRYRFNNNSNLVFLTLTPSTSPNIKPNSFPFIGNPGQKISITHTLFDPTILEVEIAEHDVDTLAIALYGNQSKSIQDGKYTIYNFNNEIYKQYNLYEIQDQFTGEPLYEIREEIDDIDETKDFDSITTPQQ
jgi:hypothetical protein